MGLGDKAAALALAERAMTANPIEKDAMLGPFSVEILTRVAARTEEPERAIAALEKLLSTPYRGPLAWVRPLTRHCSGSIRCSIRCAMIRASRNSPRQSNHGALPICAPKATQGTISRE